MGGSGESHNYRACATNIEKVSLDSNWLHPCNEFPLEKPRLVEQKNRARERERERESAYNAFLRENSFFIFFKSLDMYTYIVCTHVYLYIYIYSLIFASSARNYPPPRLPCLMARCIVRGHLSAWI